MIYDAFLNYLYYHSVTKKLISPNEQFKNKYLNKRCFILGNGPSLSKQNLSAIRDEYVFTVNYLYKCKQFEQINTNFHLFMDPGCFIDGEHSINDFLPINKFSSTRPVCFVPTTSKDFFDKYNNDELDIKFLHVTNGFDAKFPIKYDITKEIPGFNTVIQYAILVALYMGFTEIYLLGCDCTGIITDIQVLDNYNNIEGYNYHFSDTDINNLKKAYENRISVYDTFQGWANIFKGYELLYEYCKKLNIKLFNATHGGILDVLPRVEYSSLF